MVGGAGTGGMGASTSAIGPSGGPMQPVPGPRMSGMTVGAGGSGFPIPGGMCFCPCV